MRYYVQTMPGVEQITWLEVKARLSGATFGEYAFAKDQNGILLFDYSGSPKELFRLRTSEDIFVEALSLQKLSRDWRDLRVIRDRVAKSTAFARAADHFLRFHNYRAPITFRIVSRKFGNHQYRRKDFEESVAKGVGDRFPTWRLVGDGAKVEIWANLLGSRLLIGLRLSDRTMRHRFKKAVQLQASLRPSVAAALVFLSDPSPEDIFVDPMCGTGTLLLERQLSGAYRHIVGGDIVAERATAAWNNLAAQRKDYREKALTVSQWDGRSMPFRTASIDKIACNLPFGQQVGTPEGVRRLYPAFLSELERVLRDGGRAVLFSSEFDLVKDTARKFPGLQIVTGYSIAVLGKWGRAYLLQRNRQNNPAT